MADDRIDIEIADKVDATIDGKIAAIGTAAKSSHTSVMELRSELAKIKSNSIAELSKALRDNATATVAKARADSMAAAATDKAAAAYLKSELALNKAVASEVRARTEAQRLATETEKTAAAATKAATAELALAAAQERRAASEAKAAAGQGRATFSTLQGNIDRANGIGRPSASDSGATTSALAAKAMRDEATAASDLAARVTALRTAIDPLWAAQQRLDAELANAKDLFRSNAIDARTYLTAISQSQARFEGVEGALRTHNGTVAESAKRTKLHTHELTNLGYQLNDVFVSLASGQKPLTVFIQQGSQIGQIMTTAGISAKALALQIGAMLLPFAPLVAAIALAVAGFALFNRYVNEGVKSDQITKDLGKITGGANATKQELYKLKEATITWGDTSKALFSVVGKDIVKSLGLTGKGLKDSWKTSMDFLTEYGKATLAGIYALFAGTKAYLAAIEKGGITGLLSPDPDLLKKTYGKAYDVANDYLTSVGKRTKEEALKNARERTAKEIGYNNIPKPKKEKVDHTAENRAAALAKINRELDSEIRLMGVIGPQREAEAKFDEINNGLLSKKIKLNDAETKSLKDKIATIIALKPVQQEMDRIYEEATGPQRTYQASLDAAKNLLDANSISLAEYTKQIRLAENALQDATDPLAAINRGLDDQLELAGKFGQAKSQIQFLQQVREAYRTKGESMYEDSGPASTNGDEITVTGARKYKPEVQEALDKNKDLSNKNYRNDTLGGLMGEDEGNKQFIENYRTMMDEIAEMRKNGDISEAESYKYRGELAGKYAQARLATESAMLGQLSDLQNSSVKEIAAIGKAAAVAQATIDGYVAVQKALASAPPPFNYVLAGIVGVAAAANVAKIAGFERGGYTGDGGRSEVAGVVHGKEFVVNATGTARNRELLEMMNRGATLAQGTGYEAGGYVGNTTTTTNISNGAAPVINTYNYGGEPVEVQPKQRSDGGFDFDVIVGKMEKHIANRMQQGGTPINQATERRYGLNPARGNSQ